jgi:hypothetical protein
MQSVTGKALRSAVLQQFRHPTTPLSWRDRAWVLWETALSRWTFTAAMVRERVVARGRRKPPSAAAL